MTTFAVAHMRQVTVNADIVRYLERIDATLAPFDGRFVIHGGPYETLEGHWTGDLVVIAFPHRQAALDWYGSAAYRKIRGLRTDNSVSDVVLVEGSPADHRATDVLAGAGA
jgi:uncharacterized protein (DUF1330 family)